MVKSKQGRGRRPDRGPVAKASELEQQLQRANERLELLSEFARGMVFEFDSRVRYVDVWTTHEGLLARPPGELTGGTVIDALGEEVGTPISEAVARVYASGLPEAVEYQLTVPVGTRTFRGEAVRVRNRSGPEPYRVAFLVRDVTDQKLLESRLAEAERLAGLGMLAAGVGHEINNPLAFVSENLRLIAQELLSMAGGPSPPELAPRLDVLARQVPDVLEGLGRIQAIVAELRFFGRDSHQRSTVDLHKVLEASLQMTWGEIRHRARLDKELGAVPAVDAVEGQLGQVFLNLLVNATQAVDGRDGARIGVRARTDARGWAIVEVSDNGRGIPPGDLAKIFDPFFTTKRHGMGLGLSLCRRIVQACGGTIEAESEVGRGTTLRVSLPPGSRAPASEDAAHGGPALPRLRILVIDDEQALLRVLRISLEPEYDVVTAASSAEGLAVLAGDRRFDAVLCDLMMPQGSGIAFYEELGQVAPELRERVVFMTGGAFTVAAQSFVESVAENTLDKPFTPESLRAVLRRVWQRGAAGRGSPTPARSPSSRTR